MAVYSPLFRNAHLAVQNALQGVFDVLLAHEPSRPRPYVIWLRNPNKPRVRHGYAFQTEIEVMAFFEALNAEAQGTPLVGTGLVLIPYEPPPPTPKKGKGGSDKHDEEAMDDDSSLAE